MSPAAPLVALLLAAVLVVEAFRALSRARRTVRLNRALHELRRPLQAISLALEGRGDPRCAAACLEQARSALVDLDAAVNDRPARRGRSSVALSELIASLEDRWRPAGVKVEPPGPGVVDDADRGALAAALDNLVANALRHGSGPVRVRTLTAPGVARFEVVDDGPGSDPASWDTPRSPRHGHGLKLARGVAASHGGVLIPPRRDERGGTVAAISIPAAAEEERD